MKANVKILKRRLVDNKKQIDRLKKELSFAELDRKKIQSELNDRLTHDILLPLLGLTEIEE